MTFGAETDEEGSHAQLDHFVEAGGTLIDTADVYSAGRSEEIIGSWLANRPADVTEAGGAGHQGPRSRPTTDRTASGLSARHLTRALDASLRRLGSESIDLYQVHAFDPWTPLEETLRTLDGFIRAGKIRYYGLSNFTGWQLTKLVDLARALNVAAAGDPAAAVQPHRPRDRVGDRSRRAGRRARSAAVEPAGRRLAVRQVPAGRASRAAPPDSARTRAAAWRPTTGAVPSGPGRVIEAVEKVADARGVSMAEVALAWVTDRPGVTSTILGARTLDQLETNLQAADLHLTAEETAALDDGQRPARHGLPVRRDGCRSTLAQPRRPLREATDHADSDSTSRNTG